MGYRATTKVGSTNITVEAKDIKDLFKQIGVFSDLPTKCDCGSHDIRFRHRVAKDFDFYSLLCGDCGKEFALGQSKDQVNLFPKGPWAKYQRDGGDGGSNRSDGSMTSGPLEDDDIPF